MASTERTFLRMERPGYPIDITGIVLLEPSPDGPLPFEQVQALFRQRCHRSGPMTRVVTPAPLGIGDERWSQVATLDIDQHMHHMALPDPGDMATLLSTVLELSKDPLDRSRPLWEAWYLTGMPDGVAALVLRTHHAALDGVGLMQLHRILFDTQPTPVDMHEEPPQLPDRAGPSQLRRALYEIPDRVGTGVVTTGRIVGHVRSAATTVLLDVPTRVAREAAVKLGLGPLLQIGSEPDPVHLPEWPGYIPSPTSHPPMTLFNKHVDDPRKSMAVISLPLQDVQQVRNAFPEVTVNDVLLALVTGTLREYLGAHDDLPASPIRTTCPVNVRSSAGDADQNNNFTTIWIDLPVHLTDPTRRLAEVSASATAAKKSLRGSQASWDALADVGDLLLPGLVGAVLAFPETRAFGLFPPTQNLTTSTVVGSREPLYLAGRKITHMYGRTIVCPPIHLFVSSVTYAGKVDFSITTVAQLCPDPEALAEGLRAELDRLLAAAPSQQPARRRRRPQAAAG